MQEPFVRITTPARRPGDSVKPILLLSCHVVSQHNLNRLEVY
jgi:hypothetical protein